MAPASSESHTGSVSNYVSHWQRDCRVWTLESESSYAKPHVLLGPYGGPCPHPRCQQHPCLSPRPQQSACFLRVCRCPFSTGPVGAVRIPGGCGYRDPTPPRRPCPTPETLPHPEALPHPRDPAPPRGLPRPEALAHLGGPDPSWRPLLCALHTSHTQVPFQAQPVMQDFLELSTL